MAYATKSDISKIWGNEFVTDLVAEDVVDVDLAIDEALDNASAEIDGHLSVRYSLPLSTNPQTLVRPCADIAVYVLANAHTRLTDTIEKRYEQTVKFLERIGAGKAGLGKDEPRAEIGDSSTGSPSGADFSANTRRFGRGRSS